MSFTKEISKATCNVCDIKSFVYGGFSSRFWLLRKHIISMDRKKLLEDLPFYCWECLTIQTDKIDFNIVIRDQQEMTKVLEFLIVSLNTVDGQRNSAKHLMEQCWPKGKAMMRRLRKKEEHQKKGMRDSFVASLTNQNGCSATSALDEQQALFE